MIKEHQTAIVTGASRGVGVYIATALAQEGMNLVLAARNAADLERVANEIKKSGVRVITVPTDISDFNALKNLCATAEAEFGAIDVLVNNIPYQHPLQRLQARPSSRLSKKTFQRLEYPRRRYYSPEFLGWGRCS